MALSNDLISQFVKATKDDKPKSTTPTSLNGTTVVQGGKTWVKLDGSDLLTPVVTTTAVNNGDRVSVTIQNHTATITGNYTDPSASGKVVQTHDTKISEFGSVVAHKITTDELTAVHASIENLAAQFTTIGKLDAVEVDIERLHTLYANITELDTETLKSILVVTDRIEATFGEFTDIEADDLTALEANITELRSYTASFTHLTSVQAFIQDLHADSLTAEQANIKYANIDFSNIGEAAVRKLFSDSGIIKELAVGDGYITGELVGVTFKGDLIEAGTLKADRLVVKGSDGNYYKLNTDFAAMPGVEPVEEDAIHGSVLVAKSLTAEKVNVDDLVAFDATIGGFHITSANYTTHYVDETYNETDVETVLEDILVEQEAIIVMQESLIGETTEIPTSSEYVTEDIEVIMDSVISEQEETITLQDELTGETSEKPVVPEKTISIVYAVGVEIEGVVSGEPTNYFTTTGEQVFHGYRTYTNEEQEEVTVECYYCDVQNTPASIHSGVKDSIENETAGVYMDRDGQFAIGDGNNHIRLFRENNEYKLEIAVERIETKITNDVEKHFKFDENGLTISAGDNTMSLRVDNDIIRFEKNGVAFGWWDGVDFYTGNIQIEVTDRAQFGNFAFIPRTDGSLSFLKVDHKAGFYAILRGRLMVFYGTYPTLDTATSTMVINDIPGELSGTTLILNGGE